MLTCYILSLAAKPMAVTLPFLLLLLDYWPLGRLSVGAGPACRAGQADPVRHSGPGGPLSRLIAEKTPLLVIAGAFCLLAVYGQGAGTLEVNQQYSLGWRIGNALISYVFHLGKLFYPVDLAVIYPRVRELHVWQAVGSALLLATVTAVTVVWRRRSPYLLVGWLWYLGMMVPVIGLLQIGIGNGADRFTYLPQIGLAIAIAWTLADACRALQFRRGGPPLLLVAW